MFLLNQSPYGLKITVLEKKNKTQIKWLDGDFYLNADIPASYTNRSIDERVTPVFNYLSMYTEPYKAIHDNEILTYGKKDEWSSQYEFNIDGIWNAIVCFDKELPIVQFYDRIDEQKEITDPDLYPTEQYELGDLLYQKELEYNRAFIYNSRDLHLKTNMSHYQVFHFRYEQSV